MLWICASDRFSIHGDMDISLSEHACIRLISLPLSSSADGQACMVGYYGITFAVPLGCNTLPRRGLEWHLPCDCGGGCLVLGGNITLLLQGISKVCIYSCTRLNVMKGVMTDRCQFDDSLMMALLSGSDR